MSMVVSRPWLRDLTFATKITAKTVNINNKFGGAPLFTEWLEKVEKDSNKNSYNIIHNNHFLTRICKSSLKCVKHHDQYGLLQDIGQDETLGYRHGQIFNV